MTDIKPKISIIIVTYNAMKWAEKCFTSIRKSSVSAEVIVIDNGSEDGTQEYIKDNFPEVIFIQSKENLGFGKANNIGIELAYEQGADYYYLMNQDTWLYEETLFHLWNAATKNPEYGVLSPIHLEGTENYLDFGFNNYIINNRIKNNFISDLCIYRTPTNDVYETDFVNAAAWFIIRKTVKNVGGFNPFFFHYGEDREYVNRMSFFKIKLGIVPKAYIVHDRNQKPSEKQLSYSFFSKSLETLLKPQLNTSILDAVKEHSLSACKNIFTLDSKKAKLHINFVIYCIKNRRALADNKKKISEINPTFLNVK